MVIKVTCLETAGAEISKTKQVNIGSPNERRKANVFPFPPLSSELYHLTLERLLCTDIDSRCSFIARPSWCWHLPRVRGLSTLTPSTHSALCWQQVLYRCHFICGRRSMWSTHLLCRWRKWLRHSVQGLVQGQTWRPRSLPLTIKLF